MSEIIVMITAERALPKACLSSKAKWKKVHPHAAIAAAAAALRTSTVLPCSLALSASTANGASKCFEAMGRTRLRGSPID